MKNLKITKASAVRFISGGIAIIGVIVSNCLEKLELEDIKQKVKEEVILELSAPSED